MRQSFKNSSIIKENFSSCTSKSNKFLPLAVVVHFFLLLSQNLKRRVGKYSHKSFLHCSLCVTNFHYGFRAININKRKKARKWRKKSNFPSSFDFKDIKLQQVAKYTATLLQPRINVTFVTKFFNTFTVPREILVTFYDFMDFFLTLKEFFMFKWIKVILHL